MINLIKHFYPKGYRLSLSDGNEWWVTGYGDSIGLAEKISDILSLNECPSDDLPKLIYFKRDKDINSKKITFHDQSTFASKAIKGVEDYRIVILWYGYHDTLCELKYDNPDLNYIYATIWHSLYAVYDRSMQIGGLPFHSGLAEFNGKGILFVGQSGTGKSTCYRRLPDYWNPLCDDETLVVLTKDNEYRAHPCPTWSDYAAGRTEKKYDFQYSVPVSALFFIAQSEKDEVIPLPKYQVSVLIANSATQVLSKFYPFKSKKEHASIRGIIFDNASNMAKTIPAFKLCISFNGRFWEKIEDFLKDM